MFSYTVQQTNGSEGQTDVSQKDERLLVMFRLWVIGVDVLNEMNDEEKCLMNGMRPTDFDQEIQSMNIRLEWEQVNEQLNHWQLHRIQSIISISCSCFYSMMMMEIYSEDFVCVHDHPQLMDVNNSMSD